MPAPSRTAERWGGFRHPAVIVVVSAVALGVSYLVAIRRPVPEWELGLTEAINGVADEIATVLYPVMQLGTLAGPVAVAAAIVITRRDWMLGIATVIAGVTTWLGAKGVKRVVDRDRPPAFLPEILIREGDGSGLGFISGHSAVAAVSAVMAMSVVPRRWRWAPPLAAMLVGVARVVHGVHLPADLVGGWAFGTLIGVATLGAVDLARERTTTT